MNDIFDHTISALESKNRRMRTIIMLMQRFDLLYRLNVTIFQRFASFLRPRWKDLPLPQPMRPQHKLGDLILDRTSQDFLRTSEGFHIVQSTNKTDNDGDGGWILRTDAVIPNNSGSWRLVIKIKGKAQRYNYLGFIHSECNPSGNLSNYFGVQSQSGRVFNYGSNQRVVVGDSWRQNDIIIFTIDTDKNTASFRYIRDDCPKDKFFTSFPLGHPSSSDGFALSPKDKVSKGGLAMSPIRICFNVTRGTHIEIMRFQKLLS